MAFVPFSWSQFFWSVMAVFWVLNACREDRLADKKDRWWLSKVWAAGQAGIAALCLVRAMQG